MRSLRQLMDDNAQIQRLVGEIDTLEKNQWHLHELRVELQGLQRHLHDLQHQWRHEYAPAVQLATELTVERDFSRTNSQAYYDCVRDQLAEVSTKMLAEMLASTIDSPVQLSRPSFISDSNIEADSDQVHGCKPTIMDLIPNDESIITNQFYPHNPASITGKHRSLWPTIADKRVHALQDLRKRYHTQMRAVGTHTCILTLHCKRIQDEIEELQDAMRWPPEYLYYEIKRDCDRHRLQVMRQVLVARHKRIVLHDV